MFIIKKSFAKGFNVATLLFVCSIIFIIGVASYILFKEYGFNKVLIREDGSENDDLNFGLEEPLTDLSSLSGVIYFSGSTVTAPEEVSVFSYDLTTRNISPVFVGGTHYGLVSINEVKSLIFAAPQPEEAALDDVLPVLVNRKLGTATYLNLIMGYQEQSLTVNPLNEDIAYMFQREKTNTEDEFFDLSNWSIGIINQSTENVIALDNAASPTWINSQNLLLYVQPTGIYEYNLSSDSSQLVFDNYQDLGWQTEIEASPNGNHVVFTDMSLGVISLLDVNEGEVQEVGVIQDKNVKYGNPVFASDSAHYAVLVANQEGDVWVEIRQLKNRNVIERIDFPSDYKTETIVLDSWGDNLEDN